MSLSDLGKLRPYRYLLGRLVSRDLKARYKGSVLACADHTGAKLIRLAELEAHLLRSDAQSAV